MRKLKQYGTYDVEPDSTALNEMDTYTREKYTRGRELTQAGTVADDSPRMSEALAAMTYLKITNRFIRSTDDWLAGFEYFLFVIGVEKCKTRER